MACMHPSLSQSLLFPFACSYLIFRDKEEGGHAYVSAKTERIWLAYQLLKQVENIWHKIFI